MTFFQLCKSFLCSRGGWIAAAVLVALFGRLVLWPVGPRDCFIALAVVAVWPFAEYAAHRFAMHEWRWTPFRKTHDRHHAEPTTDTGLPDGWVIACYYINSVAFGFTTPGLYTAWVVILTGLCFYEFVHFACHTEYQPRTWYGFAVRANHLGHHGGTGSYSMLFPCFRHRKKKRFDDTWTVSSQQIDEFAQVKLELARVKADLQYWRNRCDKITRRHVEASQKLAVKEALENESQANLEKLTADNSNQHAQIILLVNQIMQLSAELEESKQELEEFKKLSTEPFVRQLNTLAAALEAEQKAFEEFKRRKIENVYGLHVETISDDKVRALKARLLDTERKLLVTAKIAAAWFKNSLETKAELASCKATLKTYMEPLNQQ